MKRPRPWTLTVLTGALVAAAAGPAGRGTPRGRRSVLPALAALTLALAAVGAGAGAAQAAVPAAGQAAATPASGFDYAEALQDSMFFYQSERSGQLPPGNEVSWRGDSDLFDGSDNGVNLTGGYHDAGDLVKFGLPEAWAMNMLAWGLIDYKQGYVSAGQYQTALDNLRWGDDYIISAHPSANVFYGQVADPGTDHQFWGPAETNPVARPSYAVTSSCPGSDLTGQASAALAASSIVFKTADPKYSAELLSQAQSLFTFADSFLGSYSNCITKAQGFYNSFSGYWSQLVAAEIWLYRATGDATWLTKAQADYANLPLAQQSTLHEYNWTVNWDDDSFADYVWMAQLTGKQQYITDAEDNLDWWTAGFNGSKVSYSPGGEAFLNQWGSLRYAANAVFLALEFSSYLTQHNLDPTRAAAYQSFATSQIGYILGNNPNHESYEVGFTNGGTNKAWPAQPHHSTAHGSWADNLTTPTQTRHVAYGLLVGGPTAANDAFTDDRSQYQFTEGALDYNALFSGDLAALEQQYGGTPLANFPPRETPDGPQIYVQAAVNNSGSNFIEIKALVINQSAWPARPMPNASFRYYFTLDPGETPSQIALTSPYNQCQAPTGPFQYSGSTYYIQVSCANLNIEPDGEADYPNIDFEAQVQFRITFPAAHNPAGDWSFQGIPTASGATPVTVNDITLYSGNTLVWGSPPSPATAPGAPTTLTASGVSSTGATLSWGKAAPGTSAIAGYDVYTSAGTFVATTAPGTTSYTLTGLNPWRTSPYGYYVTAVDSQGFSSAPSNTATFITGTDTSGNGGGTVTPPSAPGAPAASAISATGATLTWTASTAGSNPVSGYEVFETAPTPGAVATTSTTGDTLAGLHPATSYSFDVEAVDSQGNTSAASAMVSFTTLPATPPGAPGTPTVTATSATSVSLSWAAATPGTLAIAQYNVNETSPAQVSAVATSTSTSVTAGGLSPSTTYTFTVVAVDTGGDASAASAAVTATTGAASTGGSVTGQYSTSVTSASTNQFQPTVAVVNNGTSAISLSQVTIRYWFTSDGGATTFTTNCWYAVVGCGNVTETVGTLPSALPGADHYLQIGFTAGAGSLAAGASTGQIQAGVNKTDWSSFTQTNDYSFSASDSSLTANPTITVYIAGQLAYGAEP
jgi:endoglucanase